MPGCNIDEALGWDFIARIWYTSSRCSITYLHRSPLDLYPLADASAIPGTHLRIRDSRMSVHLQQTSASQENQVLFLKRRLLVKSKEFTTRLGAKW